MGAPRKSPWAKKQKIGITVRADILKRAQALARAEGLSLSQWLENQIQARIAKNRADITAPLTEPTDPKLRVVFRTGTTQLETGPTIIERDISPADVILPTPPALVHLNAPRKGKIKD